MVEGVEDGAWATLPELDPYWNRHFGWGMVDAHSQIFIIKHRHR